MDQVEDAAGQQEKGIGRIVDYLRDAVVELEVWRQNARTLQERQALQRVTSLLGLASAELRSSADLHDPSQQTLQLTPNSRPGSF